MKVPSEFNPGKPGDEVQPQAVPGIVQVIGAILVDNALSLAIEHYISEEQLAKYAEYAINKGIRKIEVYYAGGIENIRGYYYYTQYLPKEIKSRLGVDVEVRYLASEFY